MTAGRWYNYVACCCMHGTGICHYVKFILAQTGSVATQEAMADGIVVVHGIIAGSSQDCTGSGGI